MVVFGNELLGEGSCSLSAFLWGFFSVFLVNNHSVSMTAFVSSLYCCYHGIASQHFRYMLLVENL